MVAGEEVEEVAELPLERLGYEKRFMLSRCDYSERRYVVFDILKSLPKVSVTSSGVQP